MRAGKLVMIFFVTVAIVTFFYFSGFFLPAKIEGIYQSDYYNVNLNSECKSTIVLVSNSPFTTSGTTKMWIKVKKDIFDKWNPLINKCDSIYFVKKNLERLHDSEEIKHWIGDYQLCLKGAFKDRCISRENIFLGVYAWKISNNQVTDNYNGKDIYLSYSD